MKANEHHRFECKLKHSIELLQKAEKFALMYDRQNGFHLAFSGGKDSQAIYHVAKMANVKFHAVFSPTTIDPPELIRFIRKNYSDVEFVKPKISIYNLAVIKKMLPTKKYRWCCAELKETQGSGKAVIIGVRHSESTKRAKRNEIEVRSRKYSGDIQGFYEYSDKNQKFNRYDDALNETIMTCISGKDSLLVSPIIDWTEKDVWFFLNEVVKVPHCSLYDEGQHRIGCILCPMANRKQNKKDAERFPFVKQKWLSTIKRLCENGNYCGGDIARRYNLTPEQLFDWWLSKKPIKKWIGDNVLQQTMNFDN